MNTEQNIAITPFLFGESTVRTSTIKGEPWFVSKDVCQCLGIANHNDAIKSLDEDEKGVGNTDPLSPGGMQPIGLVNESGLYALIFKSRKAEARRFRKWVTSDVLPAIRRTGYYSPCHKAFLHLIREQIALGVTPDLAARMAGKLTGIPKEESILPKTTAREDNDIDSITTIMQPGISYSIASIVAMLPLDHHLSGGSKASQASSVGKILTKAHHLRRVEKIPGRLIRYRLPAIAEFPSATNG